MDRRQRRRTGSRDANAPEIIRALLAAGASVLELSIGSGCPDLLVGVTAGGPSMVVFPRMVLLEIKNPAGKNRLSERQREWATTWRGPAPIVVRSAAEALRAVGLPPTP